MGQVSWSGVRSPSIHDAVALVVPADADPRLTAPVKHKWCTASPSHLTDGSGTLECAPASSNNPTCVHVMLMRYAHCLHAVKLVLGAQLV